MPAIARKNTKPANTMRRKNAIATNQRSHVAMPTTAKAYGLVGLSHSAMHPSCERFFEKSGGYLRIGNETCPQGAP